MKLFTQLLLLGLTLLLSSPFMAQNRANSSSKKPIARHHLSDAEYAKLYTDLKKKGYRLTKIDAYGAKGKKRFNAIFHHKTGPELATFHRMTSADFDNKAKQYMSNGYQMTELSAYNVSGQDYYAAIWIKKNGPEQVVRHRMTSQKYADEYKKWKSKGYRLKRVSGYERNGKATFAAIWVKKNGPDLATHHLMNSSQYNEKFKKYGKQGYRLIHLKAYTVKSKDYYAAIWVKKSGPGISGRHEMSLRNYQNEFDNHYYSGFNLLGVSACQKNGKTIFAAYWETGKINATDLAKIEQKVRRFMEKYDVPGLTIAIGKDERLVFARGYGLADKEKGIVMSPNTYGRIASVSKPFTAAGIMKLAKDDLSISLNSRVFGPGKALGIKYGNNKYSNFEKMIQVNHLLEHTAGGNQWDNNFYKDHIGSDEDESPKTGGPMLQYTHNRSHQQLIDWVLEKRKLSYEPGRYFAYSNFGYCLLGRIIENKTGQSYESWMKKNILKPCGIKGMFVAGNKRKDQRANEMAYYGQGGDDPYNKYDTKRMDSHGGWCASVIDLSRFIVRVDGQPGKKDILPSNSVNSMLKKGSYSTTKPVVNEGPYGKGWRLYNNNSFAHGGSLPGTYSRLAMRSNRTFYAIIINTKAVGKKDFNDDFTALGGDIIKLVEWPKHDLF